MRSRIPPALALAAALTLARSANAFEIKHADDGELVRWRRSGVTWSVDRSVREVKGGDDAVATAVAAWTGRAGAPKLEIERKDAKLEPGLDGKNAVFYAKDGFEPAGDVLAVTVLSFDERTGEVLDADIILNGKYELGVVG